MIKNRGAATAFLALLILVGVAAGLDFSAPYHHCRSANECEQTSNNNYKPLDYMAPVRVVGSYLDRETVNAISTFVIAAFTVVLAWRTGGLFKETARLRTIADQQQADLLRSIIATEALAKAAHESADVARAEFNATHRPHLIARDISIDGENIVFLLINKGDAPAIVVESSLLVQYITDKDQATLPMLSTGHNDLGNISFAVGEVRQKAWPLGSAGFHIRFPEAGKASKTDDITSFIKGETHFFMTIVYADSAGQRRRSVFHRKWDDKRRGFYRFDDPDQEYTD